MYSGGTRLPSRRECMVSSSPSDLMWALEWLHSNVFRKSTWEGWTVTQCQYTLESTKNKWRLSRNIWLVCFMLFNKLRHGLKCSISILANSQNKCKQISPIPDMYMVHPLMYSYFGFIKIKVMLEPRNIWIQSKSLFEHWSWSRTISLANDCVIKKTFEVLKVPFFVYILSCDPIKTNHTSVTKVIVAFHKYNLMTAFEIFIFTRSMRFKPTWTFVHCILSQTTLPLRHPGHVLCITTLTIVL